MDERSGGRILIDQLRLNGCDRAFCVPGESFLPALDALYEHAGDLRLVSCRHEGAAGFMAEAYGKLTGRPGVCLVTRGPGASNAAIAIHVAAQDATPLLLIVGQVARAQLGREAFQEVRYESMFGALAKHVEQLGSAAEIPEAVRRAHAIALSGRPGPVVLACPEDVLAESAAIPDAAPFEAEPRAPAPDQLAALMARLGKARKPIIIVGGGSWNESACRALRDFAEANALPVCAAFRRQDIFDNEHPQFCGYLGLNEAPRLRARIAEADLIIAVGARLDQPTTRDFTIPDRAAAAAGLIHIYPEPSALFRNYRPLLAICADVAPTLALLCRHRPVAAPPWRSWLAAARREYLAYSHPGAPRGALDLGFVMARLRARLPAGTIVTLDAGNFTAWPQRYLRYRRPGRLLGAVNGAMGYGVPAAIAAALVFPERSVVGFVGDGGMLMSGTEIATARCYGAKPLLLVVNNNMYGTIRLHQERRYPGRVIGTDLENPDFAAFARSFGAFGATVERHEDFDTALDAALAADTVGLIELRVDPEVLTPELSISGLRSGRNARA